MHLNSFEKKMEQIKGLYRLNLAIEEENEYYLNSIGGEENLKNNYPMLYESYLGARRAAENAKPINEELDKEGIHVKSYDIMAVDKKGDAVGESRQYLLSMGLTGSFLDKSSTPAKITEPAKSFSVMVSGKLFDPKSSRLAFIRINSSYTNVNQIDEHFYSENVFGQEEFWNRELNARFTISVFDEKSNLAPYVINETKRFGNPQNFAIENITIKAPVSSNPTNEIRILYGRSAENFEYPDYTYSSNNADDNKGKLWTIVKMIGEVRLKRILTDDLHYSFEKLVGPEDGELWGRSTLQYAGKDWKVFRNDLQDKQLYELLKRIKKPKKGELRGHSTLQDADKEWEAFRNDLKDQKLYESEEPALFELEVGANNVETLKFDFFNPKYPNNNDDRRYDWVDDIDKASTDNKERICYLVGGFEYNICQKNKKEEIIGISTSYQFEIHSIKSENLPTGRTYYTYHEGSTIIYIPPIHLWWGCYGRDTQIMLADGATKRADEIRVGDLICCYGNKILTVNNVIYGQETHLFRVETDCGSSICVSSGHPMLLVDGKGKAVERLTVGEEILMSGQARARVTSITCVDYNDTVYNFTFQGEDEGNYLIANDFYSGDFYAQNKLEEATVPPTEEQKKLGSEMAELMRQMKGEVH